MFVVCFGEIGGKVARVKNGMEEGKDVKGGEVSLKLNE